MRQETRRDFVRRALAAGLSSSAIATLLAGCRRDAPAAADGSPRPLGALEGELNIYNWSDYLAPDTIPAFEREFNVRVTYDTYESNEEMVAKLLSGASGYDIVVPSGYMLPVMRAQGLLRPLHRDALPNWTHVHQLFFNPAADPDNAYGVPWQWGTTGLAYRQDLVREPLESWSVLFDSRYRGKMTMLDDGREVLGAMLKYRGRSLNSMEAADLRAAKADALVVKPNLAAYLSAPVKGQLVTGDITIAQLWNGDTTQAAAEQPAIAFVLPKEGSLIWTDYAVIPDDAPHPRAAHEFLNYILRPPVAAALSDATGYGTPNARALELMKRPVPYPDEETLKRLEYQLDLGRDTEVWDRIWTEIKAG